jgi:hypothetical protein
LSVTLVAGLSTKAAEPPTIETIVKTAVENFEPLWSPPRGRLRGWVIGIDPAGGVGSRPDERLRGDLSLLTAANLYHFVLKSGGTPVLTRADGTRSVGPGRADWEEQIAALRRADCNVCLSISYGASAGTASVRVGTEDGRPDAARLADALRSALDAEPFEPGRQATRERGLVEALRLADGSAELPICEVRFERSLERRTIDAALRKACLDDARRLFAGISQFCAKRPDRDGLPAERAPVPDTPTSKTSTKLSRLARSIWPAGRLPDEQLEWFCRRFAELSITNRSLVYFDVSAHVDQDAVTLWGRTNAPRVVTGLKHALRAAGIRQTRDEVRSLPDRERLGDHLFGVCRAPMALTYKRPGRSGGLQTQILFGEPLFMLDRDDEYYLLHAGDGYWGWVHHEAVQPMTAEQFDAYTAQPRAAVARDIDGPAVRIPRGSEVHVARATGDEQVVSLPDGSRMAVPAQAIQMQDPGGAQAGARVRAALDLLYVPYVFGGCSPLGLDCSGLVANAWTRAGDKPSRDAWQQALAGRLVATRWHRAGIQP